MTYHFQVSRLTLTASFFALCMGLPTPSNAQQNALKATPLQPVIGKFSVSYERAVGPKTTVLAEFQSWFERRQTGTALWMPIWLASSTESTTNNGKRFSLFVRQYTKAALQGGFVEGGFYVGKHDIQTTSETSVLIFFNETQTESHPDVKVRGARFGGGWQKTTGHFSFELSGGLSLNGNAQNVRPTLGMKPVSPYTRIAMGFNF